MQVSTINRDLAALRRMFHLAQEWGRVSTILPKVRLLPGENQRERVLTAEEEGRYLEAATAIGEETLESYRLAGDTDLNTTMRYVHLNDDDVRAAMATSEGGHAFGHTWRESLQ